MEIRVSVHDPYSQAVLCVFFHDGQDIPAVHGQNQQIVGISVQAVDILHADVSGPDGEAGAADGGYGHIHVQVVQTGSCFQGFQAGFAVFQPHGFCTAVHHGSADQIHGIRLLCIEFAALVPVAACDTDGRFHIGFGNVSVGSDFFFQGRICIKGTELQVFGREHLPLQGAVFIL